MNTKKKKKFNFKLLKIKINKEKENSFQSFCKKKRTESLPNLPYENNKDIYSNSDNNSNSLNENDIQEIHINFRNIPKGVYNKLEKYSGYQNQNLSKRSSSPSFRNKINNSYSQENINFPYIYQTNANVSDSIPIFRNYTYTHPSMEQYEVKLDLNKDIESFHYIKNRKKENNSMDATYYRLTPYINIYDNYNSFLRKYNNNEYYSQNNSFNNSGTNTIEDIRLNNTVNYYTKKYNKHKNSLTTINNIPKPKKYKNKIPSIQIKKSNESINNSFNYDEINNNNNININEYNQNSRYYDTKTVNNADLYKNKRKIFIKKSITDYKNKNYTNRTYSPRYLNNIEKIGIKLSFNNKKKNDSIDLITPELFNDLKSYSSERVKKHIICSDLDINNKMRKKYIKRLSSYLLKNKKNKLKKRNYIRKGKYDIIDIKEKIKEEKIKRSISNINKFKKKDMDKDGSSATEIKKEDDKGGKIDFKIPDINLRNKSDYYYKLKDGYKINDIYNNKIIQYRIRNGIYINKNIIHLNSAKIIQKWWRNILTRFFKELSSIKIQSIYRGFIFRKKLNNNINYINEKKTNDKFKEKQNIIKIILIQKKWREFTYILKNKQIINSSSSVNNKEKLIHKKIIKYQYDNKFYGNMRLNNMYIQKNNNFEIIPDNKRNSYLDKKRKNYFNQLINTTNNSENNSTIKFKNKTLEIKQVDVNEENEKVNNYSKSDKGDRVDNNDNILYKPIFIDDKNNLKICYYTKEYFKKEWNKEIIYIQYKFRNHMKKKNNNLNLKNEHRNIKQIPILFSSFLSKIRLTKDVLVKNEKNNEEFLKNHKDIKVNNGVSTNPTIINYIHDIDFSINKEKKNDIKNIPFTQKCFISKNNIFLIKKRPLEYSITKINYNDYFNTNNTNNKQINKKYIDIPPKEYKQLEKYQISKSINNYIISSYSNEQKNYNYSYNNKYLISYFSNEINGNPKKEQIFEISSINTNIISSKNNNKKSVLEIDSQNKALNYISNIITIKPNQKLCYLTKNNIVINKYGKYNYKYYDKCEDIGDDTYNKKYKDITSKSNIKNNKLKDQEEDTNNDRIKLKNINNNCFISKIRKKENCRKVNMLQKLIKKKIDKRKNNLEKIYMKIIVLNNLITKIYKDNSLDKNKIVYIQKLFRKYNNNKKEINIKPIFDIYNKKLLNNQNKINIPNKNTNSRNKYSSPNNEQKENQTYDNINTSYGTNDNNIKTISSLKNLAKKENNNENNINNEIIKENNYKNNSNISNENIDEKSNENCKGNKNLLENYENNNIPDFFDNNRDKKKLNNNEVNKDNKKNEEEEYCNDFYNDRIRKAYQINIYRNKEENMYKDKEKLNKFIKLLKKYYNKFIFNKLIFTPKKSKYEDFLKMLFQRINKNINQFVFKIILNKYSDKNDRYKDSENISLSNDSDKEPIKESFFFNTLKRHLKINKIDNNFEEDNEINNLLKENIKEYFKNKREKNYIPYINKNQEENLINNQLYLFNNDKLVDYLNKCYQKERILFAITPNIIINRLINKPLKNQNLFTITRYMDNLYKDLKTGSICQNCCCKNNEIFLCRCKCHNNNNINDYDNYNINKTDILYDNKNNISNSRNNKNLINSFKKIKNKKNLKNQILKRFNESQEDSKSNNSNNNLNDSNDKYYNITKNYTAYNSVKKNPYNNENIYNRNSNHTDYIKKEPNKINNFIRNFALRKKLRKSLTSNKSNNDDEDKEEFEIINYNYNNNLKENSIPQLNLDNEQCNIYDDDVKNSNDEEKEEIKKINKSLFKKKLNQIIPFPNKKNMIIKKVNSLRYEQDQYRKKFREIIKLRDTNMNYDNEIYENI